MMNKIDKLIDNIVSFAKILEEAKAGENWEKMELARVNIVTVRDALQKEFTVLQTLIDYARSARDEAEKERDKYHTWYLEER